MMVEKRFGTAGETVVIEDFLAGEEVSLHALCDEATAVLFPASQDHKQVFEGDKGPNTGGMGVVAPVPWVTEGHLATVAADIVKPTIEALQREQASFSGCLYPGLMVDGESVKVVEFNARFGDPEAETYMRLLDGDLFEILRACTKGQLSSQSVAWKSGTAISVALVSGGYPGSYTRGMPITGVDRASSEPDVVVFHGGTSRDGAGRLVSDGGRVLYVTAVGSDVKDARRKAYGAIRFIHFDAMSYRSDIGLRPAPAVSTREDR